MKVEAGKEYTDQDGNKINILTLNSGDKKYPIIGHPTEGPELGVACCWTAEGRYWSDGEPSLRDLKPVPESKTQTVSLYRHPLRGDFTLSFCTDDNVAGYTRVGQKEITITEGEGM